MELWENGKHDPADSSVLWREQPLYDAGRFGNQPAAASVRPAGLDASDVLGRPAFHVRAGLCGGDYLLAVRPRAFCGERPFEMVAFGGNRHFLGFILGAASGLAQRFPFRLLAFVQSFPDAIDGIDYCRTFDDGVGGIGLEDFVFDTPAGSVAL